MNSRNRLYILAAVTVIILGAALLAGHLRQTSPEGEVGSKVLPVLQPALSEVREVRIVTAGNQTAVTLRRGEKHWTVAERHDHPADFSKIRELLTKLAELEVVEVKTSNPASYPQIGVESVEQASATGKLIEIHGLQGPLKLIIGKGSGMDGSYVRVADREVSYLAKPYLAVQENPQNWLARSILDIPGERVQEVRVSLTEGPANERRYTVTREVREQTDFTVPNLPRGRKLTYSGSANSIAGALVSMNLDDVRKPLPEEDWSTGVARAEYRLFDGTIITVLGRKAKVKEGEDEVGKNLVRLQVGFDEEQYRRFLARPAQEPKSDAEQNAGSDAGEPQIADNQQAAPEDPGEVRARARELDERLSQWVYEVPGYKYDAIFRPLDDFTEKG